MIVCAAPIFHVPGLQEKINQMATDDSYEERSIRFDAQRAAKLNEKPEIACSWEDGTPQRELWLDVYFAAKTNCSVISKLRALRGRYRADFKFIEAKAIERAISLVGE
jgi:hypothetical protein